MVKHISLMKIAVKEAWKYQGLTYPNPAVGALISNDFGSILSCKAHTKAGNPHGEVEVIKDAFIKLTNDKNLILLTNSADIHNYLIERHNNIFSNYTLYVTLEPCNHYGKTPPCSHLIKELGFKKVVIGAMEIDKKTSGGAEFLKNNSIEVEILKKNSSCEDILLPFIKWQDKNFVFFKLAMSQNGVISGGVITGENSRRLVHNFRNVCDLLVIGGNTVRIDRPKLDARLCNGKAPDILIYSKKGKIDKEIPLFKVKKRKVFIANNFDILNNYKNIIIEGGGGMLKATQGIIDLYAIFHSPNFKSGEKVDLNLDLELLNLQNIQGDTLGWLK